MNLDNDFLSQHCAFNPENYTRCMMCGPTTSTLTIYNELTADKARSGTYLVLCPACAVHTNTNVNWYEKITDHAAEPGCYIRICGDCPLRIGFQCSDKRAKINGGQGLTVEFSKPKEAYKNLQNGLKYNTQNLSVIACKGYTGPDSMKKITTNE